jgi:hypothetical protein
MKFSFRTNVNVVNVHVGEDGTSDQTCWFCGGSVTVPHEIADAGLATLAVEPFGEGENINAVCHIECALRSNRILAAR